MSRQAIDELKQQIPLLDYLQAHDWHPARQLSRGRSMGLCPLHADHKPSVLVDSCKGLFYCYGCGRGGDVIRFAELYHQVKFPQALSLPKRDQLLLRIGAAKKEAGRAFGFVKIQMPPAGQAVTRETFGFQVDKAKLKATEQRDGHYLLRSNLTGEDPAVLWTRYVQLTQIESAFRSLKSERTIRPIGHQLEHRADAHVLIAFLAYSLQVTLKNRLMLHAPGLTPAAAHAAGARRTGTTEPDSDHAPRSTTTADHGLSDHVKIGRRPPFLW